MTTMPQQQSASFALYHRSAWQRDIDDNKIDMGLMPAYSQDQLDHDMVRALLDNHHRGLREMVSLGANPNRQLLAPVKGAPLHLAAQQGSLKIVVTLLQLGADPFVRDAQGRTPRDVAAGRTSGNRIRTVLKLWEQRQLRDSLHADNDDLPGSGGLFGGTAV